MAFNAQHVSNMQWAYAAMGRGPVEGREEALTGSLNAQEVANTLWAYATMGQEPGAGVMRVLERRAELRTRRRTSTSTTLPTTICSLGQDPSGTSLYLHPFTPPCLRGAAARAARAAATLFRMNRTSARKCKTSSYWDLEFLGASSSVDGWLRWCRALRAWGACARSSRKLALTHAQQQASWISISVSQQIRAFQESCGSATIPQPLGHVKHPAAQACGKACQNTRAGELARVQFDKVRSF